MSQFNTSPPPRDDQVPDEPEEDLQFEKAESATPADQGPRCQVCQQPIADVYYEVGGNVICDGCLEGVESVIRRGSPVSRVVKALVFGSITAAVGSAIYYGVLCATGRNSALVSILLGFMVGGAVRKGAGNRGGSFYQTLAVFLTYTSIVGMFIPFVVQAGLEQVRQKDEENKKALKQIERDLAKAHAKEQENKKALEQPGREPAKDNTRQAADHHRTAKQDPKSEAPPKAAVMPKGAPAPGAPAANRVAVPKGKAADDEDANDEEPDQFMIVDKGPPPVSMILVALVELLGALYRIPVDFSIKHPMSGVIYVIAMWQAWKMNKPVSLAFHGPYRLGAEGADDSRGPEVIDDGE